MAWDRLNSGEFSYKTAAAREIKRTKQDCGHTPQLIRSMSVAADVSNPGERDASASRYFRATIPLHSN
ncbi:hypothetical protein [Calycomorphotria hydatis]|uniref:hypothetical protein n=1 Tax=Calycomorphotria hydatis TaxID=2528027 RepID=UPI0011A97C8F|nr:hypothetical protein [Calycomorphotria hydatis]